MAKKKKQRKIDLEKYKEWSSHLESTKERTGYSIRRMDLLTISITGAGIYIIFETLRFFKVEDLEITNTGLLIASGICFLVSISVNFISQITGFYSNHFEEKYITLVLQKIKNQPFSEVEMNKYDCKVETFNKVTRILNIVSVSSMFLGLIGLVMFYFNFLV